VKVIILVLMESGSSIIGSVATGGCQTHTATESTDMQHYRWSVCHLSSVTLVHPA